MSGPKPVKDDAAQAQTRTQARAQAQAQAGAQAGAQAPAQGQATASGADARLSAGRASDVASGLAAAAGSVGMGAFAARWLERAIIATCVIAIVMIFQPFSLTLFTWGCVLVVFGALVFNIVPFCRPDVSWGEVRRVVLIVLIVLVVAAALGIFTAWLYVRNLGALG